LKISFDDLKGLFKNKLVKYNFNNDNAEILSEIFTDNTFSGIESHGINRFPGFIQCVVNGSVKVDESPTKINSFGAFEKWNGNYGAGPLNALQMTDRGIEIAKQYGIGCIALQNSNHWMRPGYFGWYAADKGFILICWTNTIPNLPPWGAIEGTTGNNPLVIGIPKKGGNIVLDMAMSQYSYGTMLNFDRENKKLPFSGGFDSKGKLTDNAGEIINSQRPLPIGYWKGAGLSLTFDILAALLSGGRATKDLSESEGEMGPSQIFIVINPTLFSNESENDNLIKDILSYFKSAETIDEITKIYYPGEIAFNKKKRNIKEGIDLDDKILQKVEAL
jgi:3-dehydro-L-gulonate 2-dehydrogenase